MAKRRRKRRNPDDEEKKGNGKKGIDWGNLVISAAVGGGVGAIAAYKTTQFMRRKDAEAEASRSREIDRLERMIGAVEAKNALPAPSTPYPETPTTSLDSILFGDED